MFTTKHKCSCSLKEEEKLVYANVKIKKLYLKIILFQRRYDPKDQLFDFQKYSKTCYLPQSSL